MKDFRRRCRKETCEARMNAFLMLDKNERIPLSVTLHLLSCPTCRNQVRLLSMAERVSCEPLKVPSPVSSESIREAILRLNPGWKKMVRPVSMAKWVLGGILMITFMLFFNLFVRLSGRAGEGLQLSFYLVFAAFVTFYCMVFVGTNMDFFIKKISGDDLLREMIRFR